MVTTEIVEGGEHGKDDDDDDNDSIIIMIGIVTFLDSNKGLIRTLSDRKKIIIISLSSRIIKQHACSNDRYL